MFNVLQTFIFQPKTDVTNIFLKSIVVRGFQEMEYVILYCEIATLFFFFLHKKQYSCCYGCNRARICDSCRV